MGPPVQEVSPRAAAAADAVSSSRRDQMSSLAPRAPGPLQPCSRKCSVSLKVVHTFRVSSPTERCGVMHPCTLEHDSPSGAAPIAALAPAAASSVAGAHPIVRRVWRCHKLGVAPSAALRLKALSRGLLDSVSLAELHAVSDASLVVIPARRAGESIDWSGACALVNRVCRVVCSDPLGDEKRSGASDITWLRRWVAVGGVERMLTASRLIKPLCGELRESTIAAAELAIARMRDHPPPGSGPLASAMCTLLSSVIRVLDACGVRQYPRPPGPARPADALPRVSTNPIWAACLSDTATASVADLLTQVSQVEPETASALHDADADMSICYAEFMRPVPLVARLSQPLLGTVRR
jgi:hypothetical protein